MSAPFSEEFPSVANIPPQTINAAANVVSGYVDFTDGTVICGSAIAGTITTGSTVTVSWLQATDASGTSAKALTGGGWTAQTFADTADNTVLDFKGGVYPNLDIANSFTHVAMKIAVAGGTSAIMAGIVRRGPATYRD